MMDEYNFYETKLIKNIRNFCLREDIPDHLFENFEGVDIEDVKFNLAKLLSPDLTIYAMRIKHEIVGMAFFLRETDSVRVDVAFLSKARGKVAKKLANLTLNEYISVHKPHTLYGEITKSNRRSLVFSRWLKFETVREDKHKYYVKRRT